MTAEGAVFLVLGLMIGCAIGTVTAALLRAASDLPTVNARELAQAHMRGYEQALAGESPDTTVSAALGDH